MVINIRDYTERWLNDYIVYHYGHFANEYGDLDRAGLYFDLKYREAMDNLHEDAMVGQLEAIQENMKLLAPQAAAGLNIYDALDRGGLLEETMDQIASALNESIELAYAGGQGVNPDNYTDVLKQAYSYKGMLQEGHAQVSDVNAFFDLLLQGLTMAGKINTELLNNLSTIGQYLTGDSQFNVDAKWNKKAVKTLSVQDALACKKVVEYLNNAYERFKSASYKSGNTIVTKDNYKLSTASFGATITNIFQRQIGERLSKTMLAKGISTALKEPESLLSKLVESGKLKVDSGRFVLGGDKQDKSGRSSKVDIFNQRAFQLSVTENGNTYQIELGLNTSVKWYNGSRSSNNIQIVSGSPLGSYFKAGTPEHYLAYNVIAHRNSPGAYGEVFRTLKASTAATFFNEWLTGTGARVNHSKQQINKVQYLMIDGRIYSVMRIVRNICEEIARNNNFQGAFNMSIPRDDQNKWIGSDPDVELAVERSKIVNEAIDKLEISATFNSNILLQYAY